MEVKIFMTDLSNKKILIIGGSSGFGLKTAELALKANAEVIIIGRDEHRVDQSVTSLKSNANQVAGEVLDATNSEQLNRLLTHYGQFDHVISMLGGVVGLLPLQSLKSDKQLRTNFSLI